MRYTQAMSVGSSMAPAIALFMKKLPEKSTRPGADWSERAGKREYFQSNKIYFTAQCSEKREKLESVFQLFSFFLFFEK